jgi:hypothetical protein
MLFAIIALYGNVTAAADTTKRPNIVFILADDKCCRQCRVIRLRTHVHVFPEVYGRPVFVDRRQLCRLGGN